MKAVCPHCNLEYPELDESLRGREVECSACGGIFVVEKIKFDRQIVSNKASNNQPKRKQYKVLSVKDSGWLARFDAKEIEKGLNEFAKQGWRVITITTADVIGFAGKREEMLLILERDEP